MWGVVRQDLKAVCAEAAARTASSGDADEASCTGVSAAVLVTANVFVVYTGLLSIQRGTMESSLDDMVAELLEKRVARV